MLNLKKLVAGIGLLFLGSLVGVPLANFTLTSPVKIGGDLYLSIAHEQDLLATTLPPPGYLIEAQYMLAQTMIVVNKHVGATNITDRKEVSKLIAGAPRLQMEYKQAHEKFTKSSLTQADLLKDLNDSDQHVQRYFNLLNNDFLPILNSGETDKINAQFDLLVQAFEAHQKAIDSLVPKILVHIGQNEQAAEAIHATVLMRIGVFVMALMFIGLFIVYLAYKGSIKPLMRVTRDIYEGTEQSRLASSQLTHASQKLAQGASEQAAAIEETSASLEEVSSMIHSTAKNAEQAKQLASETRNSAQDGVRNMAEMTIAMESIERSSSDVAKIVKSIDEIAFQTNILALNAAVEAARAGEAGAGFAVVADEVRSLAQRSATAAHESAEKIEASIRNSRLGSVSLERVKESLGQIENKIAKTDGLVAEITMAAREQAQGIEHVSIAIEQMNKVAQDTAVSASEIAHAAEQTYDQAKRVESLMEKGITIVGFKVRRKASENIAPDSSGFSRLTPLNERNHRPTSAQAERLHNDKGLSHDHNPKLNAPGHQTERHFKDF